MAVAPTSSVQPKSHPAMLTPANCTFAMALVMKRPAAKKRAEGADNFILNEVFRNWVRRTLHRVEVENLYRNLLSRHHRQKDNKT